MAVLRAGLLGLGMMGRHHARILRDVEGVELVAVADPGGDPHRVATGLEVLSDVDAFIAAGIDIAVVAIPTRFPAAAAFARAAAGVHTLVEKPIADDTETGRRVAEAFRSRGLIGAVGHVVVLSADASQYLHVHPTDEKAAGPDAKFMTTFPASGIYKIWGQFQHEGKVFTVPYVVKVP